MVFKNVVDFIEYLDNEKDFFRNVEEINQYNIGAISELIQYYNIKEYQDPIYRKSEIKKAIQNYFSSSANKRSKKKG